MTKYTDLMIDIETFGTSPTAPVIQIGAVVFDRVNGIGPQLRIYIKPDFKKYDADPSTVLWWMQQSDDVRTELGRQSEKAVYAHVAARMLWGWIANFDDNQKANDSTLAEDFKVWAMPPSFDITILENMFEVEGWREMIPWKFWNLRDCRTLFDLAGIEKGDRVKAATAHDAVSDCIAQIRTSQIAFRKIRDDESKTVKE